MRDGVVKMAFFDTLNLMMKRIIKEEIIILLVQQVKIGAYSRVLVSTDFTCGNNKLIIHYLPHDRPFHHQSIGERRFAGLDIG